MRLWTRRKRRKILSSRLRMTRAVDRLIARLQQRPAVLVSGSAIGWYGLWQDETLTEFDGGKRCFTHRVCEAWEREARKAQRLGVRVVRLRIGLVLGIEGGMLGRLPGAVRVRPRRPDRQRPAMDVLDRARRSRAADRPRHRDAVADRRGECDRAGAGDATPNLRGRSAGALRRPALLRMPAAILHHLGRRVRRRVAARRPARHSRQGAAERVRLPLREPCAARSMRSSAMLRVASRRRRRASAQAHVQRRPNSRSISHPSRPPLGCCGRCGCAR